MHLLKKQLTKAANSNMPDFRALSEKCIPLVLTRRQLVPEPKRMAKPKPARSSQMLPTAMRQIRIADKPRDFDTHADALADARGKILPALLEPGSPLTLQATVNAIVCSRFVASKGERGEYEPTWYCRRTKLCVRCYHLLERSRAELLAAASLRNLPSDVRRRLIHLVFTMPAPKSYQQSLAYAESALNALPALTKAISAWNTRRKKVPAENLYDYAMGVHFKPTKSSPLLWSHIHLAIVAGSKVPIDSTASQGLRHYLGLAFEHAAALDFAPKVIAKKKGWIGERVLPENERKDRRKGEAMTLNHLENTFAYVCRNDEDDDTPESTIARQRLLTDLGERPTFTRSRQSSSSAQGTSGSKKRPRGPNSFHPVRLNKPFIYKFPLDGSKSVQVAPADYDREVAQMREEAQALVEYERQKFQRLLKIAERGMDNAKTH